MYTLSNRISPVQLEDSCPVKRQLKMFLFLETFYLSQEISYCEFTLKFKMTSYFQ